MQGDRSKTFAAAAETWLRRSQECDPLSPEALYWATIGSARATLALAEELRRIGEGRSVAQRPATTPALGSRERELLAFLAHGWTSRPIP
jgi:hypothetical protein